MHGLLWRHVPCAALMCVASKGNICSKHVANSWIAGGCTRCASGPCSAPHLAWTTCLPTRHSDEKEPAEDAQQVVGLLHALSRLALEDTSSS